MPVVVFSVRPSSTSAHSAGVERKGAGAAGCTASVLFYVLEHPAEYPEGKSGQGGCTLRAPEIQTKGKVRRIPINRNKLQHED